MQGLNHRYHPALIGLHWLTLVLLAAVYALIWSACLNAERLSLAWLGELSRYDPSQSSL